jgi:hypothetical protein
VKRPSLLSITIGCFIVLQGAMIVGAFTADFLPRGIGRYTLLPVIALSLAGALVGSVILAIRGPGWKKRMLWAIVSLIALFLVQEIFIVPVSLAQLRMTESTDQVEEIDTAAEESAGEHRPE